ncbi:MAG TPA: hypothetical protein VM889_04935 [Candidatus Thermoplasmatota archaeon]|nr:hypothetical protein [Candidatus Thermoplasmatota archaeon]
MKTRVEPWPILIGACILLSIPYVPVGISSTCNQDPWAANLEGSEHLVAEFEIETDRVVALDQTQITAESVGNAFLAVFIFERDTPTKAAAMTVMGAGSPHLAIGAGSEDVRLSSGPSCRPDIWHASIPLTSGSYKLVAIAAADQPGFAAGLALRGIELENVTRGSALTFHEATFACGVNARLETPFGGFRALEGCSERYVIEHAAFWVIAIPDARSDLRQADWISPDGTRKPLVGPKQPLSNAGLAGPSGEYALEIPRYITGLRQGGGIMGVIADVNLTATPSRAPEA